MPEAPLSYAMLSDPGRVRQKNEDACAASLEHGVFVVCDGVGGAAGGEIASELAAKTFVARLQSAREARDGNEPHGDSGIDASLDADMEAALRGGFDSANRAVHTQSQERSELFGMATTMVAMLFSPHASNAGEGAGTVWLANVGDSRCYRLRAGRLEQLTQDHSLVGEQMRSGLMTREQAEASPVRNVITRAIGSESSVQADLQRLEASHGDIFLLASDGLTRELNDADVAEVLRAQPDLAEAHLAEAGLAEAALDGFDLGPVCAELVRRANEKGGGDNITCLLVRVR